MQRIVRTERDEPMRYWDPNMCFVRNENGNVIPGEKGFCGNMVTNSFQNMKNKFTLKKKKKNGSDRFILSYLEVPPLSLYVENQPEPARLGRQDDSLIPIVTQPPSSSHWSLLFNPNVIKWLVPEMKKKSASSPNANRLRIHEYRYHSQHPLLIWVFRPLIVFLIQKGKKKNPSVAH